MKGKYVIDVEGLPKLNEMVQIKAEDFGCVDKIESGVFDAATLFVNFDKGTFSGHDLNAEDYATRYGLADYEKIGFQDFMRLEPPPMKVALCLVITDDLGNVSEVPRLVTADDLSKVNYKITSSDIDEAARQAKMALGL